MKKKLVAVGFLMVGVLTACGVSKSEKAPIVEKVKEEVPVIKKKGVKEKISVPAPEPEEDAPVRVTEPEEEIPVVDIPTYEEPLESLPEEVVPEPLADNWQELALAVLEPRGEWGWYEFEWLDGENFTILEFSESGKDGRITYRAIGTVNARSFEVNLYEPGESILVRPGILSNWQELALAELLTYPDIWVNEYQWYEFAHSFGDDYDILEFVESGIDGTVSSHVIGTVNARTLEISLTR